MTRTDVRRLPSHVDSFLAGGTLPNAEAALQGAPFLGVPICDPMQVEPGDLARVGQLPDKENPPEALSPFGLEAWRVY